MLQVCSTLVLQFWNTSTPLKVTTPSKKGVGLVGVVTGMVVAGSVVKGVVGVVKVVVNDANSCYNS